MAELQTTYSNTIAKGYAGMVANGETSNRITRTIEDAAGHRLRQVPVYRGTGDHGCTGTVGTLATFLGFTIASRRPGPRRRRRPPTPIAQYDNVPIMTSGAIYVAVKGAVTDGAAITVGGRGARRPDRRDRGDATHIATGWIADETVTDGICRIVKR
jgi:hypothetical protein